MQYLKGIGVPIKSWTDGVEFDEKAQEQVLQISSMPFIHHHIAIMPDVHWGIGATVGSVIPQVGAVIPAAVGVDIGCGMMAVRTSLHAKDLPESLKEVRASIENAVPHGRTNNGGEGDRGAWRNIPQSNLDAYALMDENLQLLKAKHPQAIGKNIVNHLATLGTGNHFIELCLDEEQRVWVMLHSGSRGIGNRFGSYFIELAKGDMRKWMINLPNEDLAYFPEGTEHFNDYVKAVSWAQNFAMVNRKLMMGNVLTALSKHLYDFHTTDEAVNCHHNYVSRENHFGKNVLITRKGAVSAKAGELGIIPGSMGAKSFIVRGKGNPDSFQSCSHGAGRTMSRGEAKRKISLEQHEHDTVGIECRKDMDVLDESPAAYKSIDAVMSAQSDLVEIVHTLKQVVCVKG